MMMALDEYDEKDNVLFYEEIWKGKYPRKIKIFRWEISHKSTNTHES